jgi:uncharacterized damage-inducible protein DinB
MSRTESMATSNLAQTAAIELTRYFRHMEARVEKAARSVTAEQLWIKPFAFGNSIGNLVLHLTGNLNHYVGALIAGTDYVRHREIEFTDTGHYSIDELLAGFHSAVDMVAQTLQAQDESSLVTPIADQPPIQTRLGIFIVCAAHMNNHVGQMSYLVQALEASTKEPPVW